MIIIGINDIRLRCCGKYFQECRIIFRCNAPTETIGKVRLSNLVNIRVAKCKNETICYCDGLINPVKPKPPKVVAIKKVAAKKTEPADTDLETIELEDVELENCFEGLDYIEKDEEQDRIEITYSKEKLAWIKTFSKNDRLLEAIALGYDCDEIYLSERLQQEYPGFFLVDHTTIFYKSKYPSKEGMSFEKNIVTRIGNHKFKYGTYARIAVLETHNRIPKNYEEIVVIFNYLNKFDIFATLPVLREQQHVSKQQFRSEEYEIFSDQCETAMSTLGVDDL
jgi:hypothetical protein